MMVAFVNAYQHEFKLDQELESDLTDIFTQRDPTIVIIDGKIHCGKTSFARYLSWYFNARLVHQDDEYLNLDVLKIINDTLRRRSVIYEGVFAAESVRDIEVPKYIIRMNTRTTDSNMDDSHFSERYASYQQRYPYNRQYALTVSKSSFVSGVGSSMVRVLDCESGDASSILVLHHKK
jgi:hypothetical protein